MSKLPRSGQKAKQEKMELLHLIKANYHILSQKSIDKAGADCKRGQWEEIFNQCVQRGHEWTEGRDAQWLARTKWPGIARDAKEKGDVYKAQGPDGRLALTEMDNLVLEILASGPESAPVAGYSSSPVICINEPRSPSMESFTLANLRKRHISARKGGSKVLKDNTQVLEEKKIACLDSTILLNQQLTYESQLRSKLIEKELGLDRCNGETANSGGNLHSNALSTWTRTATQKSFGTDCSHLF